MNAAKGDTENANATLSYTKITSPINGVVTDRPYYPGETPATGTPVITVMDLSQIVARAHIAQTRSGEPESGRPCDHHDSRAADRGERQSDAGESRGGRQQHDRGSLGASPQSEREPAARNQRARCHGRANGARGRCDPPSGPADVAGRAEHGHRSG